ncbi:MAG: type II toxin-antitoxin system RelE/ParE family toxin [Deltaproteobacteria bacterium]|nr:type II toxin-antitoxin system RelE/ParE family toxin [Deltaproteobacteria bacterium]
MKLAWSPLALDRAQEIAAHIALDKPGAARRWIEELFERVARLETFPLSGKLVPELERKDVREISHGRYRILYRVQKSKVSILTIRSSYRLLDPEEI